MELSESSLVVSGGMFSSPDRATISMVDSLSGAVWGLVPASEVLLGSLAGGSSSLGLRVRMWDDPG